ncbi:MAG: oligosaccharide flippase family protein [Deltaproteobacteria bacterium]|nr:oligosaccharide flippase family protein [Deltaproteobacteria bacterium]
MHNRVKSFFGGLIVDTLSLPLTMFIGILITPLFFRFISVAEFGYWVTVLDFVGFLYILNTGIAIYLVQTIAKEATTGIEDTKVSISSVTVFQFSLVIVLLLVCLCVYIFYPSFGDQTNQFVDYHFFIGLMGIFVAANAIWGWQNGILYGQNRVTLSNTLGMIQKLLMQLLPISFLFIGFGLISFPISYIIISLILVVLSTFFTWNYLKQRFSFSSIRRERINDISLFNFRSMMGGTSYYVLNFTDTIIIANFLSSSSVTVYVLTMKLANFAKFIPGKVISLAFPSIAQLIAEKNYERLQPVSIKLFKVGLRIGLFSGAVIFFLNGLFVPHWVGSDKFGGKMLSYMSAVICLRESIALLFIHIIYSTREIKTINYILFFEAIANIILSIILLRFLDINGVALATIISSCFLSLGYAWYKASKIIHATKFHFIRPLIHTIVYFSPTFAILWVGSILIGHDFSWILFVGLVLIAGFINVICFEGTTIYKYRKLSVKEIAFKVINEA